VRKIWLTASGGPFRTWSKAEMAKATPQQALRHPNWIMGPKVTIDSATLMNKALEIIEAHYLFSMPAEKIDVIIHPQSIVHSLVEYCDGSVLAQMGASDMRTPIAHALAWPDRIESGVSPLDLPALGALDFRAPDLERFPCLRLAMEVARAGAGAPVVLNAANEVAVAAFLDGRLRFTAIAPVIEAVLAQYDDPEPGDLASVLELDARARGAAEEKIRARAL
jgi:1-deoxy-D-xylulose-5-phosphate reductoisomerase